VPADAARMQVFDRVFTRVGASDDIAGGRSTFLVEMDELSTILDSATERSLVLLDEVGRGTSTADGFAIARAVTEHLHDEVGALTLFATHHHDLTAVAADLDGAYNLYFRTERTDAGVVFEHDVERGTADASYGVEVAATAGIDEAVVNRARELLDRSSTRGLDRSSTRGLDQTGTDTEETGAGETATPGTEIGAPKQMTNTDSDSQTASHQVERTDTNAGEETDIDAELLRRRFSEVDVATMTPLEALNTLAELKRWAESER
jgi:DNA mismatch repair protein MutS